MQADRPDLSTPPPAAAAGEWQVGDRRIRRMGFGSMRLTVDPDPDTAIAVLRRAVELGVNHIDTAAFSTSPGGVLDGRPGPQRWSTELIKEALRPYPEDLVIATKVGPGVLDDGFEHAKTADRLRAQVGKT